MSQHSNTTTAENNTKELIMETRPEDILCGKEKHCVSHQGSLNFRLVIDQYAAKYAEAITKQEKMNVTKEIYDMLGSQNARFLKFNAKSKTKGWEELSSLLARDKISHALRFANREKKAAAGVGGSTASKQSKSKRGHRRTGSDDSNSTLTTVATELSLEEFENMMMDDEPLNLECQAESSSNASEPRPYVYEVPYESASPAHYHPHGPPPPSYYHPAYSHQAPRPYYYPHPQSYHYGPQHQHYHQQPPQESTATAPPMAFPEKPLPAPPARESTMDVDLTYMMSEPLMDWDLDTDEVFVVQ